MTSARKIKRARSTRRKTGWIVDFSWLRDALPLTSRIMKVRLSRARSTVFIAKPTRYVVETMRWPHLEQ